MSGLRMTKWLGDLRDSIRGFDRRIYILGVGWLVTAAGFAMVIPFLSIYFHEELHISMTAVGVFFGFSAILRAIPQPFAGIMADRFGRVPIMVFSQILRAFTFVGVGYAISQGAGFWIIAVLIGFNYIFGSVLHPAANAMVADLVKKEERVKAFAFLRICGNLGWAVGPALGGFIAHISYSALFIIGGIMALLSGLFFRIFLRDSNRPAVANGGKQQFKFSDIFSLRDDRLLLEHCLISLLLFLAIAQLVAGLSLYSSETVGVTKAELGWMYFLNGFMVVVFQFPISHIFRKKSLTGQLFIGGALYAFAYFMVGIADSFVFLMFCMVMITLPELITSPPSVTMVANLAKPGQYGRYMGIFGLFQSAGWSLGPTVGGILLDVFSGRPIMMWTCISAIALTASLLFLNFGRRLAPEVNSGLKDGATSNA